MVLFHPISKVGKGGGICLGNWVSWDLNSGIHYTRVDPYHLWNDLYHLHYQLLYWSVKLMHYIKLFGKIRWEGY